MHVATNRRQNITCNIVYMYIQISSSFEITFFKQMTKSISFFITFLCETASTNLKVIIYLFNLMHDKYEGRSIK